MRLATKITLPFLALFAFLLSVLGYVLAHQILTEVERRVENEHRFVLEVATFPGFVFSAETLRQIRDRATRTSESGSAGRGEFIVLQGPQSISTLETADARALVGALRKADGAGDFQDADDTIRVSTHTLNNQDWLVLYTSRGPRGGGTTARRTFLIYPYDEIRRVQREALTRILGLGGLGLALAAGLGLLIAQWISSPIRKLAATAASVQSKGLQPASENGANLSLSSLETQRADEIGELARTFQGMLESLRTSQSDLLRSERLASAGRLAASVAHEIRNPLTSMRMTLQMLQQKAASADAATQQAYVIILGEVDRLALAVEDLLTVARPRPAQREPTDLNPLVESTLKFMERQLSHARIAARTDFDPAIPKDLPLDPNKLRQVLVNLILNALQAMVRDGTLTLRTRWDTAAKTAILEVADTGPGIPPEIRNNVYDLFVSTKPGGGGLGLAIAKQITEEHGGAISFETSEKGTTFRLRLPQGAPA